MKSAGPDRGIARRPFFRIIDANANRAGEGLRVVEDVCRFIHGCRASSARARRLRHAVGRLAGQLVERGAQLEARDSIRDVGATRWREGSGRGDTGGLIRANMRRAQESVRVLEECARLLTRQSAARAAQRLRYSLYTLEKEIWRAGSAKRWNRAA